MDGNDRIGARSGVNQIGVRAHNERLILSLIRRSGGLPGAEIAKQTALSPQTVSNILRKLENDGFLRRGAPQRGRVGKPSIPMQIDPDGALSVGMKLGRRSADLAVLDLSGEVLGQSQITYRYPMPDEIFAYLRDGMADLLHDLTRRQKSRIAGIGIAAPAEIWSWVDVLGAPADFSVWREIDFAAEVAAFSDLPLFQVNDATAACRAEHVFGRGRELTDYGYFFIGSFVGGGVALNGTVVEGLQGNAGAFGAIRVPGQGSGTAALIDEASLYLLETALTGAGAPAGTLWRQPQDWSGLGAALDDWILRAARALAEAARTVCAVIDFPVILIDGAFPTEVRARLVAAARAELARLDLRGLTAPRIEEAAVGGNARVIGAATAPTMAKLFEF
ncbi:MAG: ROK family transcriptional regulator [Rhodobacteraceae bacterium]|jgi:predicted NBD/HSP70 family sugar kinase/predicted DNA-binding transcriptional regulator|uniref:Transcriptional regulator/sugar kinase n=1 Tax=Salipiger profundus TaxID=1229727 RepID=A0A1U7D5F3_9RHOB|nr:MULTISPECIES: ROK family transcriptional regulator [Salipiger]APX23407.1 transcriptional regulator/sugar kinase [Salipiger profundus]MAB05697.1 ROK family transcriptional regulator [Paracoccaceae bacterium]GGA28844.1 sugar kinase [Salipiger profundus]SFD99001.1 transcriptional regulator, MarR family [Salipiger profundus]